MTPFENLPKRLQELAILQQKERHIYRATGNIEKMIRGKAFAWIERENVNAVDRMILKRQYCETVNKLDEEFFKKPSFEEKMYNET